MANSKITNQIPLPLLRLLSASLPVGAFAYSRGLEHAVAAGWVANADQIRDWVFGVLEHSYATLDGALFLRLMAALKDDDTAAFARADSWLSAARESQELQHEDQRTAEALLSLLIDLDVDLAKGPLNAHCQSYPAVYALAAHDLQVQPEAALAGLMWAMCDAQIAAAIRLGCIGQIDGQRILSAAPEVISDCVTIASALDESEIGNVSVMLAIGSAQHEMQPSRLFRS